MYQDEVKRPSEPTEILEPPPRNLIYGRAYRCRARMYTNHVTLNFNELSGKEVETEDEHSGNLSQDSLVNPHLPHWYPHITTRMFRPSFARKVVRLRSVRLITRAYRTP
jgi:hypothetical protein